MRHRDLIEPAGVVDAIDQAEVGQPGHHQPGQVFEGLAVVERAGENVAGLGEEGHAFLGRFRLDARRLRLEKLAVLFRLALHLLGLAMKIHERRDLGAQDFRDDRRQDVVHGTQRITAGDVVIRIVDRADENDRGCLRTRTLANESGGLEAVQAGHVHVQQDDRKILAEQHAQRIIAGTRGHEILLQALEHRDERQHLVGPIIHEEDVRLLMPVLHGPCGHR